jgi:hypothetical protein
MKEKKVGNVKEEREEARREARELKKKIKKRNGKILFGLILSRCSEFINYAAKGRGKTFSNF